MHDMFRLWCLGEEDLLSETMPYKLTDTGQGKQRVQQSPRTFKAMQVNLVHRTVVYIVYGDINDFSLSLSTCSSVTVRYVASID